MLMREVDNLSSGITAHQVCINHQTSGLKDGLGLVENALALTLFICFDFSHIHWGCRSRVEHFRPKRPGTGG